MPGRRLVGFAFALGLHLSTVALLVWLSMPTLSRNAGGQQAAMRGHEPRRPSSGSSIARGAAVSAGADSPRS
jgi:hypothetical protein